MKKLILMFFLLLSVGIASANYNYMIFVTDTGEHFSIDSSGLTIKIDDDKVIATTGNEILEFYSASLSQMYFSNVTTTSVLKLETLENSGAIVYSLDGIAMGKFTSLDEIRDVLPNGVYLLKLSDGSSLKINLIK